MPNLSRGQDLHPSPTLRTPFAGDGPSKTLSGAARMAHFQGQRTVYSQIGFSQRFPLWLGATWPGREGEALHKADVSEVLPGKKKWLLLQVCMKYA